MLNKVIYIKVTVSNICIHTSFEPYVQTKFSNLSDPFNISTRREKITHKTYYGALHLKFSLLYRVRNNRFFFRISYYIRFVVLDLSATYKHKLSIILCAEKTSHSYKQFDVYFNIKPGWRDFFLYVFYIRNI